MSATEPDHMTDLWGGPSAVVRHCLKGFREYLMEDRHALMGIMQPVVDGSTDVHTCLQQISERLCNGVYDDSWSSPDGVTDAKKDAIRRAADTLTNSYASWVEDDEEDVYENLAIEDVGLSHIPMGESPENQEFIAVLWGIENTQWSNNDDMFFLTPVYGKTSVVMDSSLPQDGTTYLMGIAEDRDTEHRGVKHPLFKGDLGANFIWCWDEREGKYCPPASMSARAQDNYALVGMLSYLRTLPSRSDDDHDDGWTGGTTISSPHAMSFLMAAYRYMTGEEDTHHAEVDEAVNTPTVMASSPQVFVSSETDNRRPRDLDGTEGLPQAYLEVVRCVVCNGRVKLAMSLASVKTATAFDCPHCDAEGGVKNPYLKEA